MWETVVVAGGIVAVYLVLAIAADHTYMPWCDEAWFATPGINLAANGSFGTPVLDETAVWNARNLRGINERHLLVHAAASGGGGGMELDRGHEPVRRTDAFACCGGWWRWRRGT